MVREGARLGAALLALAVFVGVVALIGRGALSTYHALTDTSVAPVILSPDDEVVIQSKLGLSRVIAERHSLAARIERNKAATDAAVAAVARLAQQNMQAQRDRLARIELDLLALKADLQKKLVQERADVRALADTEQLIVRMMSRPIFRAIANRQNVAFVPTTQVSGVHPGDEVYRCWNLFHCQPVGLVAELVPGEVVMRAPSGTLARGQYLLLALSDPAAAEAEILRIRERDDQGKSAT